MPWSLFAFQDSQEVGLKLQSIVFGQKSKMREVQENR